MNGGNRATKTYDPLWVGQPIPELHSMAVRPTGGCIMGRAGRVGLYSFYFFDLDFMYKKKTLIKKNHPVRIIT